MDSHDLCWGPSPKATHGNFESVVGCNFRNHPRESLKNPLCHIALGHFPLLPSTQRQYIRCPSPMIAYKSDYFQAALFLKMLWWRYNMYNHIGIALESKPFRNIPIRLVLQTPWPTRLCSKVSNPKSATKVKQKSVFDLLCTFKTLSLSHFHSLEVAPVPLNGWDWCRKPQSRDQRDRHVGHFSLLLWQWESLALSVCHCQLCWYLGRSRYVSLHFYASISNYTDLRAQQADNMRIDI